MLSGRAGQSDPANLPFQPLVSILCVMLWAPGDGWLLAQQPPAAPVEQGSKIPPDELGSPAAPLAVYPHPMFSPVLVACTYRFEIISQAQEGKAVVADPQNDERAILALGSGDWPFPIPIVKRPGKWYFDSEAGRGEILFRRIAPVGDAADASERNSESVRSAATCIVGPMPCRLQPGGQIPITARHFQYVRDANCDSQAV